MTVTYQPVTTLDEYEQLKQTLPAVLFYYSHDTCGVCKVLKPKIVELFQAEFPNVELRYIDVHATPDVAAQNNVLTVPTLDIFLQGQSFMRESRHLSLGSLRDKLQRPYHLLFDDA